MRVSVPSRSLLEAGAFPARELAEFAVREGRRPRPIYTAHKWFARRLGCVFRALLVGGVSDPNEDFWSSYYGTADLRGLTVLDPFVGGGTSVVEASRLGATVIGVDVDPVACVVTRFELEMETLPDLREALEDLQRTVGTSLRPLHTNVDERGIERTILHHFWVQVVECRDCGHSFQAHPTYLLAEDKKVQWVVCPQCGEVARHPAGQGRFKCSECRQYTVIEPGTVSYGTATCPACGHQQALIEVGRASEAPPTWVLFALEILDAPDGGRPLPMSKRRFVRARESDIALYSKASQLCADRRRSHPQLFPVDPIADGDRFDSRLLDYGYRRWTDLFNDRQLLHLSLLAEAITGFDEPIRRALAVAFSDHLTTNCMMTAYAASWRRLTPIFSVRAFRHVPRPVELNPWCDGTGRGTYPNTVRKLMRAAEFARGPKEPIKKGGFRSVPPKRSSETHSIVCATAQDLSFVDECTVDIVLTDPPYFDNIAYSELAEFFLPWMQLVGVVNDREARSRVVLESLVGRRQDAEVTKRYSAGLSDAFREVARVLKPDGLLVFTFRHAVADAWYALAVALARAGLRATQFFPAPGEAGVGLHVHEGTGLWDTVFVLRKMKLKGAHDLRVSQAGKEHVKVTVATWAEKLTRARLPFTDVDQLALYRAGLVAIALGLLGDPLGPGADPLQHLLCASTQ
jgi:putative DNA methylase